MTQSDMFDLPRGPDYPERLLTMWRAFGRHNGRMCGSCRYFLRHREGKTSWAKCALTMQTQGTGTDWRARWPACGRWEAP